MRGGVTEGHLYKGAYVHFVQMVFCVFVQLCMSSGCGPRVPPARPAAASADGGWRTMRAEHAVEVTARAGDGKEETRRLRGAIAVERPDRFRLRALGPGGITLFDIVDVAGQVRVIQSLRDPNASSMGRVLQSLAGDLQAAYDLAPRPADRRVSQKDEVATVEEPGRVIHETATSIDIDNQAGHYHVHVTVAAVEKDVTLDPDLWSK